eukprot:GILJ01002435.1.p1 GENE.GILJ01002435.1~~GILJ01002435.1.p1  ORF type:complete len:358 (-),score=48.92 GILJ01002435.1:203-1276(-)
MVATTIFATAFAPDGEYLVAATHDGVVACWALKYTLSSDWWTNENTRDVTSPTPAFSFQAHNCAIYSVVFAGSEDNPILVTGGDDEIRCWKWLDMLSAFGVQTQGLLTSHTFSLNLKPSVVLQPTDFLSSRGITAAAAETNGLAVSADGTQLYSASGDSRAYLFDLSGGRGTCTAAFEGHTDMLHCIAKRPKTEQIVTGSEDGSVRIWDIRSHECTTVLNPSTGQYGGAKDPISASSAGWIGCVAVDEGDNWLACGSAARCLSVFHLSSVTLTAAMPLTAPPSSVLFFEDKVLSAGAEPRICHWKRDGSFISSTPVSSPCLYSIAVNPKNRVLISAGVGSQLDVFINHTTRSFSFQL